MSRQPLVPSLYLNVLAFALLVLPVVAFATPIISGVRNSTGSYRLNPAKLQKLQVSLREKSGFAELSFDGQGTLTLGDRQNITGGSATARALLMAAADSANLYELESHEDSPTLAFARITNWGVVINMQTQQRREVYQVQLDFADFQRLSGAPEARASYDIGIVLLHELVHGVLKLHDPTAPRSRSENATRTSIKCAANCICPNGYIIVPAFPWG